MAGSKTRFFWRFTFHVLRLARSEWLRVLPNEVFLPVLSHKLAMSCVILALPTLIGQRFMLYYEDGRKAGFHAGGQQEGVVMHDGTATLVFLIPDVVKALVTHQEGHSSSNRRVFLCFFWFF